MISSSCSQKIDGKFVDFSPDAWSSEEDNQGVDDTGVDVIVNAEDVGLGAVVHGPHRVDGGIHDG